MEMRPSDLFLTVLSPMKVKRIGRATSKGPMTVIGKVFVELLIFCEYKGPKKPLTVSAKIIWDGGFYV